MHAGKGFTEQQVGSDDRKQRAGAADDRVHDRVGALGIGHGLQGLVGDVDQPDDRKDRPHIGLGPGDDEKGERGGHQAIAGVDRPTRQPWIMAAFLQRAEDRVQESGRKGQPKGQPVSGFGAFERDQPVAQVSVFLLG